MKKFLIANWKENPATERAAMAVFQAAAKTKHSKHVEVGVCPPFVYLEKIGEWLRGKKSGVVLGAQDVFWENAGPHTGEIGPKMLKRLGVHSVIVGHSESRAQGETDAMVRKKVKAVLDEGLRVVLCVGESARVRRVGLAAAKKFVKSQLAQDLKGIHVQRTTYNVLIAYEPIWAIGTGRNCPSADALAMTQFIKDEVSRIFHVAPTSANASAGKRTTYQVPVLYGGSANSRNLADYVRYREIDGALVGGASLKAAEFGKMIKICDCTVG